MFYVNPDNNQGHDSWEHGNSPVGEQDADKKKYWRCAGCGAVVGFWLEGYGSTPTSALDNPPENIGIYAGSFCVRPI